MKFIQDAEHEARINELIRISNKTIICSGWILDDGVNLLLESMEHSLKIDNNSITIYSSIEHCKSAKLNKLNKKYTKFSLHMLNKKAKTGIGKVHTKLYYFEFANSFIAIIGSANITKGALKNNKELSVEIEDSINSKNYTYIQEYIASLVYLID